MSSVRLCEPAAKSRFPSGLAIGDSSCIGPVVNCTGSQAALWNSPVFSRMAQILPAELNTKYFPSAAQEPQQWSPCQPGSKRCRLVPSRDISQIEAEYRVSLMLNRILRPSGDQRGPDAMPIAIYSSGVPLTTPNRLSSAPSLFATCSSLPLI